MLGKLLMWIVSASLACVMHAQSQSNEPEAVTKPEAVTFCALRKNPKVWDHKFIRVTGYVTHGYEESSIVDPACGDYRDGSEVWMEYGGRIGSETMYFGPISPRNRENNLVVEGISLSLLNDAQLQKLDGMLQSMQYSRGVVVVRATVEGHFFSGRPSKDGNNTTFGGFGHFACCTLFVIEKVDSVSDAPLDEEEKKHFAEAFHLPPPLPPAPRKHR